MKRGRPVRSDIRQHIVDILHVMGKGYGYEIYKVYRELFSPVTMRSIYYHLQKGLSIDEFKIEKVIKESGDYSWGSEVEKIYYSLGSAANPSLDPAVVEYFAKKRERKEESESG